MENTVVYRGFIGIMESENGNCYRVNLKPTSMYNSPKPRITAQKAIILHSFGVQVGFRILGGQCQGGVKGFGQIRGSFLVVPFNMSYCLNSLRWVI